MRVLVLMSSLLVFLWGCSPSPAASPTAAPSKPATSASPEAAGSPAAKPAASPAASPASGSSAAPAKPAGSAPQPVAKLPDFPTKPIEIIIPYPAGGGFDAVSRQLAIPLQKELGQPVVIKNVPGGGTRIGARQFEQAPADGHTIMYVGDTSLYTSTLVEPPEGFDLTTWQWVAGIRVFVPYVAVGANSPYKTIQEVLAADAAGTRIRMGHNGIGGFLPANAVFALSTNMKNVAHVGGFGGTGDIAPAMVRGDIDLCVFQPISSTIQFVRSGDLRPVLVLSPKRDSRLPDVPTAREAKVPGVDDLESLGGQTVGFAVVKGTPAERVKLLEQATLNALQDPDFLKWAKEAGVEDDLLGIPGAQMAEGKKKEYGLFQKNADALRKLQ